MFETKTSREAKRAFLHGEITIVEFAEKMQSQPLLSRLAPTLFWSVIVIAAALVVLSAITHR